MREGIHPNEELLQRIRESKVEGPFQIERKLAGELLSTFGLECLIPLKFWERDDFVPDSLEDSKAVANYLEKFYLGENRDPGYDYAGGHSWDVVKERTDRNGNTILKVRSNPHYESYSSKHNLPGTQVWIRIRPGFDE